MLCPLSYGASGQNPNFTPHKFSSLKFIPSLSFLHVDFLSTCCLVNGVCFFITVHSLFHIYICIYKYTYVHKYVHIYIYVVNESRQCETQHVINTDLVPTFLVYTLLQVKSLKRNIYIYKYTYIYYYHIYLIYIYMILHKVVKMTHFSNVEEIFFIN